MVEIIFFFFFFVIFYSYFGYGLFLYIFIAIKKVFYSSKPKNTIRDFPEITLFVAAYNEKDFVAQKIENARKLDYPKEKIKHLWITDGSDDGTPDLLKQYPEVTVYHKPERNGKIAAMNRGMQYVKTPIVVFSDGNTMLGEKSLKEIARLMENPKVGCIAGEKRIFVSESEAATTAGEGIYWKYESFLKRLEAEFHSVVGAAGELFAIRTNLFQEVERDTILDDFVISLRIAMKNYLIKYSPDAYAIEAASISVKEEQKRKIRIAAGSFQTLFRLKQLLNIFKYKKISFQYISHKVLRWTIVPIAIFLLYPLNIFLLFEDKIMLERNLYCGLFFIQTFFYLIALFGFYFEKKQIRLKIFFAPYYLLMMNFSMFLGFFRFIKGKQPVNWERAKRKV